MKKFDVAIIGGGVAGLWTANALKSRGYSIILLSRTALGEGQSLASQGVIHGGAKYALAGRLTDSSEQLASMPGRWKNALEGAGEVDLRGINILSSHQILWSLPGVTSQVMSFFGSKLMRGRSDSLPRSEWPKVLQSKDYKGRVFRIDEPVLDPVSIIKKLSEPVSGDCYQADAKIVSSDGKIHKVMAGDNEIQAQTYVFAAGAGNGDLLKHTGINELEMQVRPLHQLIVRGNLPDFYSVCIGNGPKPPIVTTTHIDSRGRKIWWIGGNIAESEGVERSQSEQISYGRQALKNLLPWMNWEQFEFFSARADRAEPDTGSGDRPPGAFCKSIGNVLVTWPTKLALAPDLADQVLANLPPPSNASHPGEIALPKPDIGSPPWDLAD